MILSREVFEDVLESLMSGDTVWSSHEILGVYDRVGMAKLLDDHDAALRLRPADPSPRLDALCESCGNCIASGHAIGCWKGPL